MAPIVSPDATEIHTCWVAVWAGLAESVTATVNSVVPSAAGVPLMPPSADTVSPAGSAEPGGRDQL